MLQLAEEMEEYKFYLIAILEIKQKTHQVKKYEKSDSFLNRPK